MHNYLCINFFYSFYLIKKSLMNLVILNKLFKSLLLFKSHLNNLFKFINIFLLVIIFILENSKCY